jgi:acetyl esterase/lipase
MLTTKRAFLFCLIVSVWPAITASSQNPPFSGQGGRPVNNMGERAKTGVQPNLTIPIWPGVAPGSENWTEQEQETYTPAEATVKNVVKPALLAYLPEKSKATGAGVIIAPGGGFQLLAIDVEGKVVAQWLVERGIAAFVLKYRTVQQPSGGMAFGRGAAPPSGAARAGGMDEAGKYGIADGVQAIKVVREHASEWGVLPDRVGIVGFSAGAMVAAGTTLHVDAAARPNFAAPIYGGPFGAMPDIPANLPPMFLAWAQDDGLAGGAEAKFYEALKVSGYKPEVHIFGSGGHGFGMRTMGKTSDHWIDLFYYWMEAQNFTKK